MSVYTKYRKKGGKMEDEIKVIARMDRKKKIRLYHVLLDEGRTFSAWLRDQVDSYLAEKEPKGKRRERKEENRHGKRKGNLIGCNKERATAADPNFSHASRNSQQDRPSDRRPLRVPR
jgi:hypothetical protein